MSGVKIPKGEILWATYSSTKGEPRFMITSKPARDFYFLCEITDGIPKKLGRSKSPLELEEKYKVMEKLAENRH